MDVATIAAVDRTLRRVQLALVDMQSQVDHAHRLLVSAQQQLRDLAAECRKPEAV
jgi:hypothetical protein